MERGKFITFEGIEGVGKSTNMAVFAERLEAAGHRVLLTREPGGTPMAEEIRDLVKNRADEPVPEIAELLLIFAARAFLVNNVIVPALDAGTWVICDRFTDSSRAYQGAGRGVPLETIDQLAAWVHGDTWPDLTILLDAPVDVGLDRAGRRGAADRFESEEREFFERARACFLAIAEREPERVVVLDATGSLESVSGAVLQLANRMAGDQDT
jgi:dTMP kinase